MESFCLLTCVRDISEFGGGVAKAAVSIHEVIAEKGHNCFVVFDPSASSKRDLKHSSEFISSFTDVPSVDHKIVHIHGLWTPFEVKSFLHAKIKGAKLIISPHGMLEPWALKHKRSKKRLAWLLYQKIMLSQADVIAVTSQLEFETVRRLGFKNPIAIIPNGVDFPDSRQPVTRQKTVLYLSRIAPVKGLQDLLDAWELVANKHGYELQICGNVEPGYEETFKVMKGRVTADPTIRFLGPVFGEDKWDKYLSSAIFVLPSYSENFGIVVVEAMMSSLPIITTAATPWQSIQEEGLGWIVGNDVSELRAALDTAFSLGSEELSLKGIKAAQYARDNFTWDRVSDKYLALCSWLVNPEVTLPEFVYCD